MDAIAGDEYEGETFIRLKPGDLAIQGKRFTSCVFEGCDFTSASFMGAVFSECGFKGCNLSLVSLDGVTLSDVLFYECKLVAIQFQRCNTSLFFSPSFERCRIDSCSFSGLKAKGMKLVSCQVHDTDFTGAVLSQSDFTSSDLKGSIFESTDLSACDLRKATGYAIDPLKNKVKKAKFSLPEAVSLLRCLDISIE